MNDQLIFLVEHDEQLATRLGRALQTEGRRVQVFRSGREALEQARRDVPDLVVVDTALLDTDGCALCARLRLEALDGDLPILALAARSRTEALARAAGADVVLSGPVEPQDISALVRDLLEQRPHLAPDDGRPDLEPLPALGYIVPGWEERDPAGESGRFDPATLPELVLRLHRQGFSGPLDIATREQRARVVFSRGHPCAVHLRAAGSALGHLLVNAGHLDPDRMEQVALAARRRGQPIGRLLASQHLVDPASMDQALQVQTLRRMAALTRLPPGRWSAGGALSTVEAGYPTHIAAVLWHMADVSVPVPALADQELERFVIAGRTLEEIWPLLDPTGRAAGLRLVLLGGGRLADARELVGDRVLPLLALLRATGVIELAEDPPDAARRSALLARSNLEPFRELLEADYAIACGADAYTVLGLPPEAAEAEAERAARVRLDRYRPETLPPGLSVRERACAAEVHRQVLGALRVLAHPRRRAAHDFLQATPESGRGMPAAALDHAIFQAEYARRLYRRGEYLAAAAMLNTAVLLEGENSDVLTLRGQARCRAAVDDPLAGEADLRRAVQLDSGNTLALLCLGRLLAARGERRQGARLLRRALAVDPRFDEAREALAQLEA